MPDEIIPRDFVIAGADEDPFHVGTVHHCGKEVLLRETVLRAADLQNLSGTPVVVLPALPDGLKAAVLGVYYSKAAGAYTNGAAVTINYTDSGNTLAASIPVANVRQATANDGWATRATQSGTAATFEVPEGGLDANASAGFSGDGGDLTITVRYIEVV